MILPFLATSLDQAVYKLNQKIKSPFSRLLNHGFSKTPLNHHETTMKAPFLWAKNRPVASAFVGAEAPGLGLWWFSAASLHVAWRRVSTGVRRHYGGAGKKNEDLREISER